MEDVELFILLLAGVVALVRVAGPLKVPSPVLLVLGGLVAGLLPFVPGVRVDPDAVLLVFLPPILYAAAFEIADENLRGLIKPIAFLAVPLVLVTIGALALVANAITGMSWAMCFVLGAILGPTDPVAATAVVRSLGGSDRMATILEGESLVNDATGLTAFRIAVGVAGGEAFSAGPAALEFVGVAAGGIAIGVVVGWIATQMRRRLEAPHLEITVSLITAFGAFAAAEKLDLSGILATVVAGYVVGRAGGLLSAQSRIQSDGFWSTLSFVAEATLFLLVGLAVGDILADESGVADAIWQSAVLGAVILGVRLVWMYTVPYVAGAGGPVTDRRERLLIGLSGMRGAVSVAIALAIPTDVADRDTVLLLTSGVVLLTLVPAGLALPSVVTRLGLGDPEGTQRKYVEARTRVAHAALRRAEDLAEEGEDPEELLARAREAYELRIARLQESLPEGGDGGETAERYRRIRRHLVEAEQECLDELAAEGEVSGDTLREVQKDVDLEATRLDR